MDPYKVLGLEPGASEEEIRAAYRELVKKYHPDKYQNNPLADLAEEKLREVNEAYDTLMKGINNGGGRGSYSGAYGGATYGGGAYGGNGAGGGRPDYMQARRYIDAQNLAAADSILNSTQDRSAEWFFLKGVIAQRRGWYDEAMSNLQTAVNMNPNNQEYNQYLGSLMNQGRGFQNQAAGRGYGSYGNDDMCCRMLQCYICADCCCDAI